MKILMLSSFYPPLLGGIVTSVRSLSGELSKRGHEVIICTVRQRDLPAYEERDGVKIYRLDGLFQKIPFLFRDPTKKWHPPARDWLITRKLAAIIEREKPDIIHAHDWILYSAFPLIRNLKIPLILHLRGTGFLCPVTTSLTSKNTVCDEPLTRKCISCTRDTYGLARALASYYGIKTNKGKLKLIDRFIAVSSFVKEFHLKHLGLEDNDIVVIPNFYAADIDKAKAEELPGDFMLFAGWLKPHKGVDVLIEAYQKLDTGTKLVLIGLEDPAYHYQGTEPILIMKNMPHNAVMQAMSRCRFAVFPSVFPEPFGNVAIEAMSQRKAVIASNTGGLKDVVVDGETGLLVPPGNADKLADTISYLLQRPQLASEMGARGYQRFIENYTPDAVVPMIIDVYQSLILGKKS
jgi:glycosyltransferase involved in cell wall biosynthesis